MSRAKRSRNSHELADQGTEELLPNWKTDPFVKCTNCNKFHEDNLSGEESQLVVGKVSEETFSGVNSQGNSEGTYAQDAEHRSGEYDYDISNRRRDMNPYAEEVLAKLKDLQWRRDALERHYINRVRRIIDDYFYGEVKKANGQLIIAPGIQERMRAGGIKKNQAYGVRLKCGCVHHCERLRQPTLLCSTQNPSTSPNYSKHRRPSRSEAMHSS